MTRDTYSDRERAVRAEIERQAPDMMLKYVMEWAHDKALLISANFAFKNVHGTSSLPVLKGFTTTAQSVFAHEDVNPAVIAAQLIGGARYWYEHIHPTLKPYQPSAAMKDATDWASP